MTILLFRFFPIQNIFIDFARQPMYHMSIGRREEDRLLPEIFGFDPTF